MLIETERYLGPATVLGTEGDALRVRTPSGEARARLALAVPYRAAAGDVVLVIGDEEVYVIGVLAGRGTSRIAVDGDLELAAGGRVKICGGAGVDLDGPDVTVKASRFELTASRVFQRCRNAYTWAKAAIHTCAGRTRTIVEGTVSVQADRITALGRRDVKLDGDQIHLG